jgi:hypothetical protein
VTECRTFDIGQVDDNNDGECGAEGSDARGKSRICSHRTRIVTGGISASLDKSRLSQQQQLYPSRYVGSVAQFERVCAAFAQAIHQVAAAAGYLTASSNLDTTPSRPALLVPFNLEAVAESSIDDEFFRAACHCKSIPAFEANSRK